MTTPQLFLISAPILDRIANVCRDHEGATTSRLLRDMLADVRPFVPPPPAPPSAPPATPYEPPLPE